MQYLIVVLIGLFAGVLSGLVGIGGGILMVPAMVFFLNYNQHQAQGTSLAVLTLPVVILASMHYYNECRKMGTPIDLKVVAVLAVVFLAGAYFGSAIALKIDKMLLKKIFGLVLLYTAIKMLGWDNSLMQMIRKIF
jgi:uncharacterized membrane protein YfcA